MDSLIELSLSGISLFRWVPFDIARPLLDRQPYVVLSDFAVLQNGESTPHVPENLMEMQHNGLNEEDANDIDDEEMDDADFVNSDDESDLEASGPTSVEIEDGDVSNVLIRMNRSCVRFKVCLLNPLKRSCVRFKACLLNALKQGKPKRGWKTKKK